MRPIFIATLAAFLAALSLSSHASSIQAQQPPLTRSHQTSIASSIASLSDGWNAIAPDPTTSPNAPATPSIEFTFARPGLPIPHYTLTIQQNSLGEYRGEQLPADPPLTPQPFDTAFAITPATTAKIFALSDRLHDFKRTCASPAKNIASSGTKILRYIETETPDPSASCTYDYSESKDVQTLTTILQAIAETMDLGRRIDFLHRYDRLGLDQASTSLAAEVAAGRALELTTIAPSLRSLADDPQVLRRVRTQAAALLATIPAPPPTP